MKKVVQIGRRLLLEAVCLALWLAAVPPAINYIVFFDLLAGWVVLLLLLHLARWVYLIKKRCEPRVPVFLLWSPALVLMPLWGLVLCGEIRLVNPMYPWVAIACGTAVFGLCIGGKVPFWIRIAVCLPALALWLIYFPFMSLLLAIAVLCALLLIAKVLPGKHKYRVPAWVPASAAMTFFTIFVAFRFYNINGDADMRIIESQPGVDVLFTYDREQPVGKIIGEQIMFVMEGCGGDIIYIGMQGGRKSGLIKYEPAAGRAESSTVIGESSDNMILDCERNEIAIGDFSGASAIRFIRADDISEATRPPIPVDFKATRIEAARDGSRYYALNESHTFFVYPGTGGKAIARITGPDEWIYYTENDYFVAVTEPDYSMVRFRYEDGGDAGEIVVENRQDIHIPVYQRLDVFLQRGIEPGSILVSNMWAGTLSEMDDKFREERRKFIAPGVRNIAVTPDGDTIIVAGYADGHLYFLDAHSWRIITKCYIGRRIRGLNFSSDGQFLYAGSSQGGFRMNITTILNAGNNGELPD